MEWYSGCLLWWFMVLDSLVLIWEEMLRMRWMAAGITFNCLKHFRNTDNVCFEAKERKEKDAKRPKFRDFTNINGKKVKRKKEPINRHVTLKYIMDILRF